MRGAGGTSPLFAVEVGAAGTRRRSATGWPGSARSPSRIRGARDPALRALLLRYAVAFNTQVAQTAACNGRHPVEQRLARWMLMAHDRSEGDEFPMPHEFLALMLGVRRPGVTVATHILEGEGMIRAKRGMITILNREKLRARADGSYGLAEAEYERLIAPVQHGSGMKVVPFPENG